MIFAAFVLIKWMLPTSWQYFDPLYGEDRLYTSTGIFVSTIIGLVAGVLIGIVTEYYTGTGKRPVTKIAHQSLTGSATNIISGLGVGMRSTMIPILLIAFSIIGAFYFGGLYGIAIAAVGMLSNTGIQLAVDAYGQFPTMRVVSLKCLNCQKKYANVQINLMQLAIPPLQSVKALPSAQLR